MCPRKIPAIPSITLRSLTTNELGNLLKRIGAVRSHLTDLCYSIPVCVRILPLRHGSVVVGWFAPRAALPECCASTPCYSAIRFTLWIPLCTTCSDPTHLWLRCSSITLCAEPCLEYQRSSHIFPLATALRAPAFQLPLS